MIQGHTLLRDVSGETLSPFPRLIGEVPPIFRPTFVKELPIQGYDNQKDYNGYWRSGQELDPSRLHPDIRHIWPIVVLAAGLGGLSVSTGTLLEARLRQGEAADIFPVEIGWHCDIQGSEIYRRIVMSDVYGTIAALDNGSQLHTPDFGMLMIDGDSLHKAQEPPQGVIRTRLQVTLKTDS